MQLEGKQSILSALAARKRKFEIIFLKAGASPERFTEILEQAERQIIPVKFQTAEELDRQAHGKSHGGIIALCSRKKLNTLSDLSEIIAHATGAPLLLLLEGVEDAQHLGYIIRTAEALGAQAVLLKKHLWDFDETAVTRASSGAFERLPIVKFSQADEIKVLKKYDIKLWGCLANARNSMYEIDFTKPVALAVGGEKRGLSGKTRQKCDGFLRIPMFAETATSLSLTHAACLLLGEAARQRWLQHTVS